MEKVVKAGQELSFGQRLYKTLGETWDTWEHLRMSKRTAALRKAAPAQIHVVSGCRRLTKTDEVAHAGELYSEGRGWAGVAFCRSSVQRVMESCKERNPNNGATLQRHAGRHGSVLVKDWASVV